MLTKSDIKFIVSLRNRKEREERKMFIAEGVKVVEEMILAGVKVITVFATREWFDNNTAIIRGFSGSTNFVQITDSELHRISNLTTPNDVLALVEMKRNSLDCRIGSDELVLALDGINDPGNMGTIIRTACWFGVTKIVCSKNCVDIYNQKVVQATMGAIFGIDVFYLDLALFLRGLDGVRIYGTLLDGDDIYNKTLTNGVVVIGSESHGVSDGVRALITDKLLIPRFGSADVGFPESLNAAIATAVVLSEFKRSF